MGYFSDGFHKAINLLLHMDDATFSAITATLVSTSCALGVAMALGLPLGFLLGYTNFPAKNLSDSFPIPCSPFPPFSSALLSMP